MADSPANLNLPSQEDICAIIITYNPDNEFPKRLSLVAPQVGHVVIVDNHSSEDSLISFKNAVNGKVELIENPANLGIAVALNKGVRRASEMGFKWVLTLDEDSILDEDMIDRLIDVVRIHPKPEEIGVIGSNARSKISNQLAMRYGDSDKTYFEEKTVISSGSLIPVRVYNTVGPFRDDFFIEGVDLEYCLRVRKHGFKVYCTRDALMTHSGGRGEEHKFFGRAVLVTNHLPWRYHLIVRNFVAIVRMYLFRETSWVLGSSMNFVKVFVKITAFEENKLRKYAAIARGLKDGLFMRL